MPKNPKSFQSPKGPGESCISPLGDAARRSVSAKAPDALLRRQLPAACLQEALSKKGIMPEFLELVFKHEGREKGGFFKCLGSRNFSLLVLFGKGGTKRLRKPFGSM